MKKRSLILLPLMLLGSVGGAQALTSCTKSEVTITFAEGTQASVYVGAILDLSGAVSVEATGKATKDVVWSSSNEEVLTVDQEGFVNGVSAGTAKVIVTSAFDSSFKAEFDVTVSVKPLPAHQAKTVEEMLALTATDTQHIYEVTGIVSGIVDSDYGNFDLYSLDGTKKILVYGSTLKESCIAWNKTCSALTFTNPKDFRADNGLKANLHYGDRVTMVCTFTLYNNTTAELMGYVKNGLEGIDASTNHTDYSATVSTTKVNEADAEATLSKSSGLYIGELVTVNVPAVTDYRPVVKVNGVEIAAVEGAYSFIAGFQNVVTVTYEEAVPTATLSFTRETFFDDSSAAVTAAGWTVTGLSDQKSYNEFKVAKSSAGSLAFDLDAAVTDGVRIKKLTIKFYNYENCKVYVGTDATGTLVTGTQGTKDSAKALPVTYEFGAGVKKIFIVNDSGYDNSIFGMELVYVQAEA